MKLNLVAGFGGRPEVSQRDLYAAPSHGQAGSLLALGEHVEEGRGSPAKDDADPPASGHVPHRFGVDDETSR
ncbi:hypothetical protein AB0L64_11045 [Kribbella sp. NPDC051936]|uniref:hypothetical protein n=1 Tax=Kribbella sp. NPDC051936 TaxID=3154946 RepID=UPI00344A9F24